MWASKTLHPLYFESAGRLPNFSVSYTAMALAGLASVLLGRVGDRFGDRALARGGIVLYAAGLALRVFPYDVRIAAASGLLAGLGASAVLISLRYWLLAVGSDQERAGVQAARELGTQAGVAVGSAGAGLLVILLGAGESGLSRSLLVAAVLVLAGLPLLPSGPPAEPSAAPAGERAGLRSVLSRNRRGPRGGGAGRQCRATALPAVGAVRRRGGLEQNRCVLLGGSFGGSLALLAAQLWPSAAGAIACSPVVDLRAHAHRAAKQDRRYADWFEKRFGLCQADRAAAAFSPDNLVDTGSVPVLVVHGTADEVVDYGLTKAAVELAQRTGRSWSLVTENDGAHVPASPDSAQTRSDLLLASVARLLDAV